MGEALLRRVARTRLDTRLLLMDTRLLLLDTRLLVEADALYVMASAEDAINVGLVSKLTYSAASQPSR